MTNLEFFFLGFSVLLLVLLVWQILKVQKLDKVRKEFFADGMKKNIEQVLMDQNKMLVKLNKELKEQDLALTQIYKDNRNNLQKIGFIRFNPFDNSGGNISFALALLDAHDDGFVISSLHGREGTRVYAKTVKKGTSESQLTEEEVEAIKHAK